MQKLGRLSDWQYVEKNEKVVFPTSKSGVIQAMLKAVSVCTLYFRMATDKKSKPVFLTSFDGIEEISFTVSGEIEIFSDVPFQLKTHSGLIHQVEPSGESFTRIVERRTLSADALAIQEQAYRNKVNMARIMQEMKSQINEIRQSQVQKNENISKSIERDVEPTQEPKSDSDQKSSDKSDGEKPSVDGNKNDE